MDISAYLPHLATWVWAAMVVVVYMAAIVQAGLGMGFGLAAAPLLAIIEPAFVPGPALVLGLVTSLWAAAHEPQGIAWKEVLFGIWGRIAGVALGAALLATAVDRQSFVLIFGIMIAIAVILSVFRWRMPFNKASLLAMSAISGTMGVITSVGAPPLALIYQHRSPQEARPTLAAFFTLGCAVSISGLVWSGWFGVKELALAATMFPPMIAGTLTARLIGNRFDKRYRPVLLIVAGVASLILIARGLS